MTTDEDGDWRARETAPQDGAPFWGLNAASVQEYVCWYDDSKKPADALARSFADVFQHVWWSKAPDGRITSFHFDFWRPMTEEERQAHYMSCASGAPKKENGR